MPKNQKGEFRNNGVWTKADDRVLKTAIGYLALPYCRASNLLGTAGRLCKQDVANLKLEYSRSVGEKSISNTSETSIPLAVMLAARTYLVANLPVCCSGER
jgi:hypothetical protein